MKTKLKDSPPVITHNTKKWKWPGWRKVESAWAKGKAFNCVWAFWANEPIGVIGPVVEDGRIVAVYMVTGPRIPKHSDWEHVADDGSPAKPKPAMPVSLVPYRGPQVELHSVSQRSGNRLSDRRERRVLERALAAHISGS